MGPALLLQTRVYTAKQTLTSPPIKPGGSTQVDQKRLLILTVCTVEKPQPIQAQPYGYTGSYLGPLALASKNQGLHICIECSLSASLTPLKCTVDKERICQSNLIPILSQKPRKSLEGWAGTQLPRGQLPAAARRLSSSKLDGRLCLRLKVECFQPPPQRTKYAMHTMYFEEWIGGSWNLCNGGLTKAGQRKGYVWLHPDTNPKPRTPGIPPLCLRLPPLFWCWKTRVPRKRLPL